MKILNFFEILKFCENFEILWKLKFFNFLKILKPCENLDFFFNFLKISQFSFIDDEVRVFRINIKLLSNPVAELKIRENDSHWLILSVYIIMSFDFPFVRLFGVR